MFSVKRVEENKGRKNMSKVEILYFYKYIFIHIYAAELKTAKIRIMEPHKMIKSRETSLT